MARVINEVDSETENSTETENLTKEEIEEKIKILKKEGKTIKSDRDSYKNKADKNFDDYSDNNTKYQDYLNAENIANDSALTAKKIQESTIDSVNTLSQGVIPGKNKCFEQDNLEKNAGYMENVFSMLNEIAANYNSKKVYHEELAAEYYKEYQKYIKEYNKLKEKYNKNQNEIKELEKKLEKMG